MVHLANYVGHEHIINISAEGKENGGDKDKEKSGRKIYFMLQRYINLLLLQHIEHDRKSCD